MVDISKLKFRHLYGELYKKKFENVHPSTSSTESCGIKGNPLYFSFSWKTNGGGSLAVFRNNDFQKLSKIPPLITGHQGQILDFDFYPFNDHQLATSSEDCTIKFWQLPEEITDDLNTPLITLTGHQKKVSLLAFNNISSDVIATASADHTVKLWNLAKQTENISIPIPDHAWSLQWNLTNDLLGLINKDKQWRIMDPRTQKFISATKAHTGPKSQSKTKNFFNYIFKEFTWLGEQHCLTTGLSKSFERQFYLYDIRNTEKPIQSQVLDNSSGTLFPFFDNDTNILFLAGKGDANIRYYEFSENQLFFCSNFTTTKSGTGYGFFSKRSVNTSIHEVMRGLKLTDSTVEFIKFCAPRKSEIFQEDLFPNTIGHIPAQSADDFFSNKNANAILVSLNPNTLDATTQSNLTPQQFVQTSIVKQQEEIKGTDNNNYASVQQKLQNEQIENQELKKKNQQYKSQIAQLEITLKKKDSVNDGSQLQQQLNTEKEKTKNLQLQLQSLQEKVIQLENSTNSNNNNADDNTNLNEFRKQELDFLTKLQQIAQQRQETLKVQMKQ